MAAAGTHQSATQFLDHESILVLANEARSEQGAVDKLAVALVTTSEAGRRLQRHAEFLERENTKLEQRLATLLQRLYGRSSEKIDRDQLRLFLAEHFPGVPTEFIEEKVLDDQQQATTPPKKKSKGHGRDSFTPNIPRNEIRLDPKPEECICGDCKEAMTRIREEATERGTFIPGYWSVNRFIRGIYACKKGCGGIVMADLPPTLIEKGRFEPSVAVHAAISKFADHLPLNRQEQMHERVGVPVSASTLGDQIAALGELHAPTVEQGRTEVMAASVVHADDTPVTALVDRVVAEADSKLKSKVVSDEKRKKIEIEVRQWVYLTTDGKVHFDFTSTRAKEGPLEALKGLKGHLITDGYAGFDKAVLQYGLIRCGCWAHVRRKFKDALTEDKTRAALALRLINRLFWIERGAKLRRERRPEFGDDDLIALRKKRSKRILDKFWILLGKLAAEALPGGALGKAVTYAVNQWEALIAFVENPKVAIHNNAAERALRTVAIGRKNYLFYGSLRGGETAAVFYSLIGSCKALGLDPYAYLMETTAMLIADPTIPRVKVTPWAWAKERGLKISIEIATAAPATD